MRRTLLSLFALLPILGLAGETFAEAPQVPRCAPSPPPFEPAEANQLKRDVLQRRLQEKTIAFTRPMVGPRGRQGGQAQYRIHFRGDGSMVLECRARRMNESGWHGCQRFGPEATGDRDVGTWRLDGDQLVMQRTRHGIEESRVTLHAQGTVLVARRISGAPCMPGLVTLE